MAIPQDGPLITSLSAHGRLYQNFLFFLLGLFLLLVLVVAFIFGTHGILSFPAYPMLTAALG
jgi:hypothetical protein